jgi:hypothetical protein
MPSARKDDRKTQVFLFSVITRRAGRPDVVIYRLESQAKMLKFILVTSLIYLLKFRKISFARRAFCGALAALISAIQYKQSYFLT